MRTVCLWALAVVVATGAPARGAAVEPVGARHGMVASTSAEACEVGAKILARGGTAADAAVAVALVLAVVWPSAGNLGGGGFMLHRTSDGAAEVIDYRERAPLGATRDMYLDAQGKVIPGLSINGYRAVAVPGTVAGLALAHKRHGKLPWAELVEPARRLAAEGIVVGEHLATTLRDGAARLDKDEAARAIFMAGGQPLGVGDRLVQPDLAKVLARLAADPRDFYQGETAKLLVAAGKAHGGLVTARDLVEYEPTVRAPLRGTYRGYEVITMPLPSSGGIILLEALNMLERFKPGELGFHSADELHLLVEVMKRAFADRGKLGDSDFVKLSVAGMLSKRYAESRAKTIDMARATPSKDIPPGNAAPFESMQTTHFTIVDAAGNAVSNTYTLNGLFGAAVVAPGTGIVLNNEMDDFAASTTASNLFGLVQGEANTIAPKKRPLSTMTPTMLVKDGKLVLAIGSPGGPTIVTTVLQILVGMIDFGMNAREAIQAPRFHHQHVPDSILWEPWALTRETRAALEARGHTFAPKPLYFGDAEGVAIDPKTNVRLGASDPRFGGVPAGY